MNGLTPHQAALVKSDPYNYGESAAVLHLQNRGLRERRTSVWESSAFGGDRGAFTQEDLETMLFLRVHHQHRFELGLSLWGRVRRRIIQNIDTCTLWQIDPVSCRMRFRPWPRWTVSAEEYQRVVGPMR